MVITEVSETENDSSCEQAEVRLVVKFIVEEQIFFRGKILDRTPLESEEISRIVSKIALSETQLAGYEKSSTTLKHEKIAETTNSSTIPTIEVIKSTVVAQDDLMPTESVPCPDLSSQKEETLPPLTDQQPQSPPNDSLDAIKSPDMMGETPPPLTDQQPQSPPNDSLDAIKSPDMMGETPPPLTDQQPQSPPSDSLDARKSPDMMGETSPSLTDQQPQSPPNDSLGAKKLPDMLDENTMAIQEISDTGPSSIGSIEEKSCLTLAPPERLSTVSSDSLLLESQITRTNNAKVFAKWTDLHFYPGTVQKPTGDKKYIVNFCDGGTKASTVIDLIPVMNVNKKNVRVAISKNLCVNAIVYGQHSQNQGSLMFDVEYNHGGNSVRRHVPFKDIFLTPEQGSPLVDQTDRVPGASNFADVDLDNIIFEKRPRRFQEMDNYLPEKLPIKRRRKHLSWN